MIDVFVRDLGSTYYPEIFCKMRDYSRARDMTSNDEIWITEHNSVFTLGQAAKKEHVLAPGLIPVYQSDRGGQVTYHGPGQITVYFLVDIKRLSISVRQLVDQIESVMIRCVAKYGITARRLSGAPGVYVDNKKIGSLGLRVTRGKSYHGMSLNVDMELEPFSRINPCGLSGMKVTQVASYRLCDIEDVKLDLLQEISRVFGFRLHRLDNSLI
tara:strand:+ start:1358 stop:1996 length:639 start_codon:yes stop_codon:yes gene_type:complete